MKPAHLQMAPASATVTVRLIYPSQPGQMERHGDGGTPEKDERDSDLDRPDDPVTFTAHLGLYSVDCLHNFGDILARPFTVSALDRFSKLSRQRVPQCGQVLPLQMLLI